MPALFSTSASAWVMGLPISRVMVMAYSALFARSSLAAARISRARSANGRVRHSRKAACVRARACSIWVFDISSIVSRISPVAGLTD